MQTWEYSQLIMIHGNERPVRRRIRRWKKYFVHDWVIHWVGPEGENTNDEIVVAGDGISQILNLYGQHGWEVAASIPDGDQLHLIMKRQIA